MEDTAIIQLYWDRNEDAIAQTDLKYGALCRRIALNILASREDSEECVSDTWHRAWSTMPPQRPFSLRAYLGRIVRNLSISRLRERTAQKRGGGLELMLSELEDCLPAPHSTEQEADALALADILNTWLYSLSADDRVVFVRRYWYGDDVRGLASQWSCSPNQMTKRLSRLRRSLKVCLEKEGISV